MVVIDGNRLYELYNYNDPFSYVRMDHSEKANILFLDGHGTPLFRRQLPFTHTPGWPGITTQNSFFWHPAEKFSNFTYTVTDLSTY